MTHRGVEELIMHITRRTFLGSSAAGVAALNLPRSTRLRPIGANDDIRVAVVGIRSRGTAHIKGLRKLKGVRVVALCDVDEKVLRREARKFTDRKEQIAAYLDYRELLEDDSIDAVSIATPNHWHALMAIWAIGAGKDVYLEKPVSHNVWEGRKIVEAARKHERIVQTGTQSRSNAGLHAAVDYARGGELGAIEVVRGLCYKPRGSIGKVAGAQDVPGHINYDLWCGPAPKTPLMRKRLHYDWHWVWSTGCGDIGNQGIHQMDMCRMVLGVDALAPKVMSIGGRLGYIDDGETPNSLFTLFDYPNKPPMIFETRGLPKRKARPDDKDPKTGKKKRVGMDRYRGASIGVVVECEGGTVTINNYAGGFASDADGKKIKQFKGGGNHFQNFIDAVRSRRREDLNADILEGHLSSALCHVGNISYLRGKAAGFEQMKESLEGDASGLETLARLEAHIAANGVDLKITPCLLGKALVMDPAKETFVDDPKSDALLRREYRAPFVVPESV